MKQEEKECFICGCTTDCRLENSHDIPQYIGGEDSDGIRWLCYKHHREYDLYLLIKFLKSIGENPKFNNWVDVKNWQCEIKKQESLHQKFQKIAKDV